jgi:DNA polymerase-3 subunit beta
MKASCEKKDLQAALNIASSASSARTSSPMFQTLRLDAEPGSIELLGCDGEMWASASAPANVEEAGSVCVQQRLLADIVAVLSEGTVDFEVKGTQLWLRQGHSEWLLTTFVADMFPGPAEVEEGSSLRLPMGEFQAAVESVAFAASEDPTRQHLTGVLFRYDGSDLALVATDTHRLAVNKQRREGIGSPVEAIVPTKALRAIRQLPVQPETEVEIRFDNTRLSVDVGNAKVVSSLLTGQYPNWERVVPQEFTRQWTVDRAELFENVRKALVIGKDNAYRVRFTGKGDRVLISAQSPERGEANQEIPAIVRNGDLDIAFNGRYIMDALQSMPGDGVVAELTEPSRPAVIRPVEGGEERFCVVMPMALN